MYISRPQIRTTIIIILLSAFLTACMVGPNFHSPASPKAKRFTESPLPAKTVRTSGAGGQAQTFLTNKDIPIIWWELFHSPAINQLIHCGLAKNPSLASASAALRQAQENLNVQIGNSMWPAVNALGYAQRQRYSELQIGVPNAVAPTFNLFYASVNVAYTLDVFGGARREIESLRAQVDYQQFQEIAAYLTLTSNIVTTSISIASYQAQIKATLELIKAQQGILNILNKQYRLGGVSNANVRDLSARLCDKV